VAEETEEAVHFEAVGFLDVGGGDLQLAGGQLAVEDAFEVEELLVGDFAAFADGG
jgi:hypothetical protein